MASTCEPGISYELEDTDKNLRLEADEENHDRYTKRKIRKEDASDIEAIQLV